ncbi:MAG: hypothetical protein ABSF70_15370 [Terracidiphilus sp.]
MPASTSTTNPAITWNVTPNSGGQLQSLTVASQPWTDNPAYPTTLINAPMSNSQPAYDPLGHLVFGQFALNTNASNTPAAPPRTRTIQAQTTQPDRFSMSSSFTFSLSRCIGHILINRQDRVAQVSTLRPEIDKPISSRASPE